MDTLLSVLMTVFEGSVAVCKFMFKAFFFLFIPFIGVGMLAIVSGFEGFLYAGLLVRLSQFVCMAVFLLSGVICLATLGIVCLVGNVLNWFGYSEI